MSIIELEGLKELAEVTSQPKDNSRSNFLELMLDHIDRCESQPRRKFDATAQLELEKSIKENGVIQPIVVRKKGQRYEIVAGERRWRACKSLGLASIPAYILSLTDKQMLIASIIENVQREDLTPLDKAGSYLSLIEKHKLTHAEVAEVIGKSRSSITNHMRLLELEPVVQSFVQDRKIEMGHARALVVLKDQEQLKAATIVIEKRLSVRQTEELVKKITSSNGAKGQGMNAEQGRKFDAYQVAISTRFQSNVNIKKSKNGSVKLVFELDSEEELEKFI